ncbi:MAG: hypothetical protein SGJ02_11440 [bacterium]|nr:hypothetical protein [bacterium]
MLLATTQPVVEVDSEEESATLALNSVPRLVFFANRDRTYVFSVCAGRTSGHNQPTSLARLKVRQAVAVVYSKRNPSRAYEDTTLGFWGMPISLGFAQIIMAISSLMTPRRKGSPF